MIVKLLTEHHLEFLKEAAQARPSYACQIVGNRMPWLILLFVDKRV